MSQTPTKPDLVTVNIDGRDIAVPKGTNMIEAAALLGIEVPHFCYHPKLPVSGNCRMCLVEMGMPAVDPATKQPVMDPATGKQKVNWMPRPTIACATARNVENDDAIDPALGADVARPRARKL